MSDKEILERIKDYFSIKEFVDKPTFDKYGEKSWQFICPRILETMLFIREEMNRPITINNWHVGGKFSQRGLRTNKCQIVESKSGIYLSAHVLGKAVDFDVKGMSAVRVREWLMEMSSELPFPIRLENLMKGDPISWVHLDVYSLPENSKVYLFNV